MSHTSVHGDAATTPAPGGLTPGTSPAAGEPRRAQRSPSRRRLWALLGVVLVADALDLLDATITNIAAPTIVTDIGGGPALIKWLGAAYALALGSLLVVGGRLGDRFGQRRLFLIGMAGFTLASAAAGLAVDPAMMIVARVAQGAFGALLIPQGMAIMTKTFPKDMLTTAFGAFGPLLGICAVGGPVLAGFIIDADFAGLGWRPMFLINIVLGGLGLVAASILMPRDAGDPAERVDVSGSALLGATMFALLYGLIEGSTNGWTAVPVGLLLASAVLFAGFCRRQVTAADPLIKPSLLRNKGFTSGLAMGLAYLTALTGLNYVISLFLQVGLGYPPSRTSLALVPMTVGIILGAGSCMALIGRLGRRLVVVGLLITLAGTGDLLAVVRTAGVHPAWWQLTVAILLVGVGMGTCIGTIFDNALGDIDHDEAGAASGSLSAIQQIAAGLGSATITSIYFATLKSGGQLHAMTLSLGVVIAITTACLAIVPLLPRKAAGLGHG